MGYQDRYEAACEAQGFKEPLDESPVTTPDGWRGGSAQQTGGFVICRIWRNYDSEEAPSEGYEVAYGENAGVSLQRYEYDDEWDAMVFVENVENRPVDENTDEAKAEVAKELMENFEE